MLTQPILTEERGKRRNGPSLNLAPRKGEARRGKDSDDGVKLRERSGAELVLFIFAGILAAGCRRREKGAAKAQRQPKSLRELASMRDGITQPRKICWPTLKKDGKSLMLNCFT